MNRNSVRQKSERCPTEIGIGVRQPPEYAPKHASWLSMAELEIGIMGKQCTGCRLGTEARLTSEVAAWQLRRNVEKCGIEWTFTREKADKKLSRHYVP